MRKVILMIIIAAVTFSIAGCGNGIDDKQNVTNEWTLKEYSQRSDGTWECNGELYQYKLEVSGKMSDAALTSIFVYLSNVEYISFEKAWNMAGLNSDYREYEDAILVEYRVAN